MSKGEQALYHANYNEKDVLGSEAAELATEIMNATVTGEFRGVNFQDIDYIKLPSGEEVHLVHMITAAIKSQFAEIYLAGRADQIADNYRSPAKRTLRARDIPLAIDAANAARVPEDRIDKQELLDEFRGERGASLDQPVFIQTSTPQVKRTLLEYVEAGDIRVIGYDGEERDVLPLENLGEETQGEHDD